MSLEKNLFISYAHIDDQPLTAGQQGWITRFHETLEALLSMRLGQEAKIWRDEKLQGNDVFDEEIVAQFSQADVFISVLTSRYLNSEWCTREIREFCENAQQSGDLVIDNKSRVFKVIKTPLDNQETLPDETQDILGYEFFTLKDGTPLELDPAYGEEYAQLYNQMVAKLAWDVAQLFKKLETDGSSNDSNDENAGDGLRAEGKPEIYLAECSYDRKPEREIIEGELKRLGYTVLPNQRLPADEAEYVAAVESLLTRCALSIHLVGRHYGGVPDGASSKSATVLQNELAVARCKSNGLSRLIWMPAGTRSEEEAQKAFIEALHQDGEVQYGADLITGDIEQFKAAIHTTLKKLEKPESERPGTDDSETDKHKLIYLICTEEDRKDTVPVRKYFRDQGIEVAIPAFEGDATAVRGAHQQMMGNCDGIILFYGAGDEAWKRTIDSELQKLAGYRAGKPLLASYTYLAEPKTADKEDLIDMEEPHLINGFVNPPEAEMSALVQSLNPSGATA